MTNGKTLGNKLYELRKEAGLSQEELAEKLDVSRQAVSKWECGDSLPDTDNLITISKLFGVSLDELVGNTCENAIAVEAVKSESRKKGGIWKILHAMPYPIVVTIAFLLWGFILNGWGVAWTLYITIPVYYSLIDCIRTKKITHFAYPVFITFIYCFIGMMWGLWHPFWILFITIPIYYPIADAIDKR